MRAVLTTLGSWKRGRSKPAKRSRRQPSVGSRVKETMTWPPWVQSDNEARPAALQRHFSEALGVYLVSSLSVQHGELCPLCDEKDRLHPTQLGVRAVPVGGKCQLLCELIAHRAEW
jgi:hypothetical protein